MQTYHPHAPMMLTMGLAMAAQQPVKFLEI
jgi:hypothetical protein